MAVDLQITQIPYKATPAVGVWNEFFCLFVFFSSSNYKDYNFCINLRTKQVKLFLAMSLFISKMEKMLHSSAEWALFVSRIANEMREWLYYIITLFHNYCLRLPTFQTRI